MEAAIRTAHYLLTGRSCVAAPDAGAARPRGREGEHATIAGRAIDVAAVSAAWATPGRLLDQIRAGRSDLHFIEVMTCPGGCIDGGGQPRAVNLDAVRARMQALYTIDRDDPVRASHHNPGIQRLYDEFLGEPLGETQPRAAAHVLRAADPGDVGMTGMSQHSAISAGGTRR